jgi:hypothetical protein
MVGHEHNIVVAVDGTQERRIIFLPLARIGAGFELLACNDARA